MILSAIAARLAGRGRHKRPTNRTVAARDCTTSPMQPNTPRGYQPTANDRQATNHYGIKLFGHDCSSDQEGELIAIYSPLGGAMDGQIAYARPRDFVDLREVR